MAIFDWYAERTDLSDLALLDRAPESEGIDLKAVFTARNSPTRYLLLTAKRSIMFEFAGCLHLAKVYEAIDEVRTAASVTFTSSGPKIQDKERKWAQEMAGLVKGLVGKPSANLGLERLNARIATALKELGLNIVDAQQAIEMARTIKSAEEAKCIVASLRATEVAVGKLRDAITPGLTENQLWSVIHKSVIEQNGDYVETRLLSVGPRTNPWFQETASHAIGKNQLVALGTDVVGCHGYYSDFSRSFHSGPDPPTEEQRELYRTAHGQITHNMSILKPGLTFQEYADLAWGIPKRYWANRYFVSAHGCGLTGEYPYLCHRGDFPDAGYDGIVEPGMVLCVESYIGKEGGVQGVKLEQQVLITETGIEVLSKFPLKEALLE
ncbi:putative peptidase yqhT [Fusarium austroafricanum]|uniref:Putative peptidase yqhT n=1 Tax=Fusarium austroafricanum TaxID=2364996 RepID=A0A8H4KYZ1_9HYPO|nr:putative peptidase yqhT [Fusarium austroafricanum]